MQINRSLRSVIYGTGLFRRLVHMLRLAIYHSQCKTCTNSLVYPDETLICRECSEEISRAHQFMDSGCRLCGRPFETSFDICGDCILNPPPFIRHASYSRYSGVLKELILKYKYTGLEKLKHSFADFIVELYGEIHAPSIDAPFDYIVPVPPDKSRKRDYDTILEISKLVSKKLKIPLLLNHLVKVKETSPQARLNRENRLKNLDGAFKLINPHPLENKKLLLIDDIYTTGTTIKKCTSLLTRQGADVIVLTLAHS
jgi:competence protein ComFC